MARDSTQSMFIYLTTVGKSCKIKKLIKVWKIEIFKMLNKNSKFKCPLLDEIKLKIEIKALTQILIKMKKKKNFDPFSD